jgi:dCMP deaminase
MSKYKQFMDKAIELSKNSRDESTKVGTVIIDNNGKIIVVGYNDLVKGCKYSPDVQVRPVKYKYFEHGERNAIYAAAYSGISVNGCTIISSGLFPCVDCARGIIQSGIAKVVTLKPDYEHPTYGEDFKFSLKLLMDAGVEIEYYEE